MVSWTATATMAFRQSEHEMSVTSLDSSVELRSRSPSPQVFNPRKLRFADDDFDKDTPEGASPQHPLQQRPKLSSGEEQQLDSKIGKEGGDGDVSMSPPCQKVRALRLFSTPATPKTILQKSTTQCSNHLSAAAAAVNASRRSDDLFRLSERPRSLPLHNRKLPTQDTANVNPFTPDSKFKTFLAFDILIK